MLNLSESLHTTDSFEKASLWMLLEPGIETLVCRIVVAGPHLRDRSDFTPNLVGAKPVSLPASSAHD